MHAPHADAAASAPALLALSPFGLAFSDRFPSHGIPLALAILVSAALFLASRGSRLAL